MRPAFIAALMLIVPLAACDDGKEGATISVNADDDGNIVTDIDGNSGTIALKTPVFSGQLKVPGIDLKSSNFDMNGVHLYPGSTIAAMNVNAGRGDSGTVKVDFDSPADPATVRDWFKDKLTHAGFTLAAKGNGLTGTTDDKKPFTLDLAPADGGHARGRITIDG